MFEGDLFRSWSDVLVGAALFASMFMLAALMIEMHVMGTFRFTGGVAAFGAAAFSGYIFVARLICRVDSAAEEVRP